MKDVTARNVGSDGGLSLGGEMKHGVHTKREQIPFVAGESAMAEGWGKLGMEERSLQI